MNAGYISANNKSQAGTHNSPEDRDHQVLPKTTIGDKRLKQTQKRTKPPNNLVDKGPEGPMDISRAGSTFLTIRAINTGGKRWTPDTTPEMWETRSRCQRTTGGNTRNKKPGEHSWVGRGAKKSFRTWKSWKGK